MKKRLIYFLLFTLFLSSCSKEEDILPSGLTAFQTETINYFKEIALGFEFGSSSEITRRWEVPMKIYVGGQKKPILISELNKVINEINELTDGGFSIAVVSDSSTSNYYLFLGSGEDYGRQFPSSQSQIGSNFGLFSIYWNNSDNLYTGRMYVDIFRADEAAQRHLLREELTQSLGLGKDSFRYSDSIFQQSWTLTTDYSKIDRELIRLLYHSEIHSGLNSAETEDLLTAILLSE